MSQVVSGLRMALGAAVIIGVATFATSETGARALGFGAEDADLWMDYPQHHVACEGRIDEGCAVKAATTAMRPVAWVPTLRPRSEMIAVRKPGESGPLGEGRIFQVYERDGVIVRVATAPGAPSLRTEKIATVTGDGGVDADLLRDPKHEGFALLRWSHGGQAYEIHAVTELGSFEDCEAAVVDAFRNVRYNGPPAEPARSGRARGHEGPPPSGSAPPASPPPPAASPAAPTTPATPGFKVDQAGD